MHYQLVNYLEQNNLFLERHFAKEILQLSKKKSSAKLHTAYLLGEVRNAADKGLVTGALFAGVFVTFDTHGRSRLIIKVQSYDIKGQTLLWSIDYLFVRHQL